ncbi:MAG: adenylate kinase [Sedimentisphaerales bacterium]|nr:adenylate kinase [Sedimentisphaerales bacterium]
MRIVLLGAPGSGKGTQCKSLVEKYGLLHMSSGDILRKERAAKSELGQKAQSYMDSGALVPDDLIIEMMSKAIKEAPKSGFILDGFPRTVNQAIELDKAMADAGMKIDFVLNLEVDDSIIEKRITGRRSCPKCGAVYHIENMKPKQDGICDNDETELVQRADDTAEVVAKRLDNYHQQTEPLVDYYKKNGNVYDLRSDRDPEIVKEDIFKILDF